MPVDALFSFVETLQGDAPWGSVLDAGTGKHSLEWVLGLETRSWTAVTGDPAVARKLTKAYRKRMRPDDRLVAGNWTDPAFLHGESYDVVLADYLLGAVEGFARHFQDRLFRRLAPHVGGRLFVIGLSPYPEGTDHPWGKVILEIARLRDACILLAGHRTYREYPLDWAIQSLEEAGFRIDDARAFPIRYGEPFVRNQLRVCRQKLRYIADRELAAQLARSIASLEERALLTHAAYRGTPFGEDWVVSARPARAPESRLAPP